MSEQMGQGGHTPSPDGTQPPQPGTEYLPQPGTRYSAKPASHSPRPASLSYGVSYSPQSKGGMIAVVLVVLAAFGIIAFAAYKIFAMVISSM